MGNIARPEALLYRSQEMQRDPSLQDLPYKIELAYLAAGAREVWLVYEQGKIRYIDDSGEKAQKGYP